MQKPSKYKNKISSKFWGYHDLASPKYLKQQEKQIMGRQQKMLQIHQRTRFRRKINKTRFCFPMKDENVFPMIIMKKFVYIWNPLIQPIPNMFFILLYEHFEISLLGYFEIVFTINEMKSRHEISIFGFCGKFRVNQLKNIVFHIFAQIC